MKESQAAFTWMRTAQSIKATLSAGDERSLQQHTLAENELIWQSDQNNIDKYDQRKTRKGVH